MEKAVFIELAIEKYGEMFDYRHLPEIIKRKPEIIICNKHGEIKMIPRDHLRTKYGCPRCASNKAGESNEVINKRYIELAKVKFDGKFDYSKVDYNVDPHMKVIIGCPMHGDIQVRTQRHYYSMTGCFICGGIENVEARRKYKDLGDVVPKSREIFGDVYEYLEYDKMKGDITYRCAKHGITRQRLSSHFSGRGCQHCKYDKNRITPEIFLAKAKLAHPEGYEYNLDELISVNHKITITHKCGHTYKGRVSNHLSGQGCMRCKSSSGENRIGKFLELAKITYISQFKLDGYKYRYDFYLPQLNLLIEYDGEQHFRPVDYFGGRKAFKRLVRNDAIKTRLAKDYGYGLLRISYKQFEEIELILSRAIDNQFNYRVNDIYYSNFVSLCVGQKLPPETKVENVQHYRTINVLSPLNQ